MRKRITSASETCRRVLHWMDSYGEALPLQMKKPITLAQRAEYLLMNKLKYIIGKSNHSPIVRALLDQILFERRRLLVSHAMRKQLSFSTAICYQVLAWMVAHEEMLPKRWVKPTTALQRAEFVLRNQFNNLRCKADHPPVVRVLIDQILQQRRRPTRRRPLRKPIPSSITKCKKVLEWLDAHEERLPVLLRKPTTDDERAEVLLRRQFNYLRSKTHPSPELRAVLEQIESRISFLSDTRTCKKVLVWMYGHDLALPKEFRKPTTDNERAEYLLRNQFKYLKRKTIQPPEVLALLDQIKRLSLQVPKLKQCLTVAPWSLSSEDNESCELPVPKRRRLLVKTKDPSFALDASLASTAESALKRPAVLFRHSGVVDSL
jgi:arsenate reductase-like glutaredoxin family protein